MAEPFPPNEPTGGPERPAVHPDERARRDLALVRAVLAGRGELVPELAERLRCIPRILAVQNRRKGSLLNDHDLEDLSQEVVVVILRKLDTYAGLATLEGWVHRIAFLELMNRIRGKLREPSALHTDHPEREIELAAPTAADPDDYAHVEESLELLGPPEADVVRLKHFEQKSFAEIGRTLGISASTAKGRYYRGIVWLQRHLWSRVMGEQG